MCPYANIVPAASTAAELLMNVVLENNYINVFIVIKQ